MAAICAVSCAILLCAASAANAISITFDESGIIPFVTTDPGFTWDGSFAGTGAGDFRFWAGDPSLSRDTFADNSTSVSGNSLASGFWGNDSVIFFHNEGSYPLELQPWKTFAKAAFTVNSAFDSGLILNAYNGGVLVASASVAESVGDTDWSHTISLTIIGNYPTTRFEFRDELGGSPFNIDDFEYSATVIPEPATLLLLGAGMGGLVVHMRRRRSR